jgi:hypothetical protein
MSKAAKFFWGLVSAILGAVCIGLQFGSLVGVGAFWFYVAIRWLISEHAND